MKLRSIDNVNIVISMIPDFQFPAERDETFKKLYKYVNEPDWRKGLRAWQLVFNFTEDPFTDVRPLDKDGVCPHPDLDLKNIKSSSRIAKNVPVSLENGENVKEERSSVDKKLNEDSADVFASKPNYAVEARSVAAGPTFRVSCQRVGGSHNFGSPEAARQFGGGINEKFGWPVKLSEFDLEVVLYISEEFVYVALCLTKEALFKRNLSHFGPTNLRSTICYNMVRLAKPQPGDVIVDPLCGGATIPIEGSLSFPQAIHIGGDNYPKAIMRSHGNIENLCRRGAKMPIDVAQWDVTRLPIRDQSVDVIVSDMPFGKRIGSKMDNRVLYYKSLVEMARVTRIDTGRAVLLTQDRNSMIKNIQRVHTLWKSFATRTANIGGLTAGVFYLQRTGLLVDPSITIDRKPNMHWREREKIRDANTMAQS
ncbi:tRNA (guanine(6)-N(2))-methyltransferase THUMP3-like isoform X2 [Oratosquilla oratoria]